MSEETNQLEKLFETTLEIDPTEAPRSDEELLLWDKEIASSRFMLYKGRTETIAGAEADHDYYKLPFVCTVDLPHDLRLSWARLEIKFEQTAKLKILKMEPQLVTGKEAVSLKAALSANVPVPYIPAVKLGASMEATRKVYPPKITGSGLNSQKATWTFDPTEDGGVYLRQELELEVSVPTGTKIDAYFNFKAHVTRAGILKFMPVFAAGKPIEEIYRLNKTA